MKKAIFILSFISLLFGCSKDDDSQNNDCGSIMDFDGNTYNTVQIGDQCWMAENLKTTHYANGDPIPNITDQSWTNLNSGAWVHYDNNPNYDNPYGKLYNWYTVSDPRKICPTGWRVPTKADWQTLVSNVGGIDVAGDKLKESGTDHWMNPNPNATNESGFTAVGGGVFNCFPFQDIKEYGYWWASTDEGDPDYGVSFELFHEDGEASIYYDSKCNGLSVRCIKN